MSEFILHGGRIVSESEIVAADLWVADGKVAGWLARAWVNGWRLKGPMCGWYRPTDCTFCLA